MRVQITDRTVEGVPSDWCVVDDDGLPVPVVARYLRHLVNIEVSPFTRRAYAFDIASYLTFLQRNALGLDDVTNEVLGRFAHWLRAPEENVVVMADASAVRSRATVNRALTAVASFYTYLGSGGRGSVGHAGHRRLKESAGIFRRPDRSLIDNVGNARHQ